eukprot:Skav202945  [mRNA]  locus=scaffold422:428893:433714:+ [translate_table: standard]
MGERGSSPKTAVQQDTFELVVKGTEGKASFAHVPDGVMKPMELEESEDLDGEELSYDEETYDGEEFKPDDAMMPNSMGTLDHRCLIKIAKMPMKPSTPAQDRDEPLGAATPVLEPRADFFRDGAKKPTAECEGVVKGFGWLCERLSLRLGDLLNWRCKTKPTGRIFPLPSSSLDLNRVLPHLDPSLECCLRCLVVGLNSLNGEGNVANVTITPIQKQVLSFLEEQCRRALSWESPEEDISWEKFFRVRGIDYKGEEVQTAQPVQWENLSPALPDEVGTVDLEEVVEHGSLHYVKHFEEYLLPPEDQVFTKPPKVMVAPEHWESVAKGLISKGICRAIHEDDIYKVDGKVLLNGLFGVSKNEFSSGFEVRRLIMNLIPLNRICRSMEGDVSTLPSWAGMTALQLHPTEDLVISSEDVRCFFYIFRVPLEWHKFLAFNKVLPVHLTDGRPGRHYLCSTVLPMGFRNSVSLAQHVHRVILKRTLSQQVSNTGFESEIRKDRHFPRSSNMYRIYLDNFDQLQKVDRHMSETIGGQPTELVQGLRSVYSSLQVPRHPKKSVEQRLKAEVQGAIVDGQQGVAYPRPEKVLRYCRLGMMLLEQDRCTQKQLQVVAGGFVYMAMYRRPLLGCLNHLWSAITAFEGHPPVVMFPLSSLVKMEIARFLCLSPLSFVDFRLTLLSEVTASDASEYGGGVTVSRGLSEWGAAASRCQVRGELLEQEDVPAVLTVGLFDGIAALRVAVDCLGWNSIGHVSVECSPEARRVVESQFPATEHFNDVTLVDEELVKTWSCRYSQSAIVVLGAGPPCQGVSGLNVDRKGALKDQRSNLYIHVGRIRNLLKKFFPWARVVSLMESVASMDDGDLQVMSTSYGDHPFLVDAQQFSLCRRPRFYWIDWEILPQDGVVLEPSNNPQRVFVEVKTQVTLDAQDFLTPGWKQVEPGPFPTFTTSRCRPSRGRRPAGLHLCASHEVARWENDWHRFPPYQYLDRYCLKNRHGELRLPNVQERECILGFPKDYTKQCFSKQWQGGEDHDSCRYTLLGNSWSVPVVTWLLGHLGTLLGLHGPVSAQAAVEFCSPGSSKSLGTFLQRPFMKSPPASANIGPTPALELVQKLAPMVSLKGQDLLLQADSEDPVKYHRLRASLPAKLWKWSTAASWRWLGQREHINVLEMRAVLCALRYRLERQLQTRVKFIHMVDSLVVLHSLSRGRSSSRKLRRTLLRINSYDKALQKFFTYLQQNQLSLPTQKHLMDGLTSDYIEHLWSTGEGRALAADTLAAIQDAQPQVKGSLQGTWRLLKTWNTTELPNRAPPMPMEVLEAMVGHALLKQRPLFAISLLLGFHGLLRTGEILGLTKRSFSITSDNQTVLISLGLTKGGRRQGVSESVKLSLVDVTRRIKQWLDDPHSPQQLTGTPHQWRKLFNETITALGWESLELRPYSLRRGGSTFQFRQHGSLDRLMLHGRWLAAKTARLYVNEGMAVLTSIAIPWNKFTRTLRTQYLHSVSLPLPPLEPLRSRAGAGGKRNKNKAHQRKKELRRSCKGCVLRQTL